MKYYPDNITTVIALYCKETYYFVYNALAKNCLGEKSS